MTALLLMQFSGERVLRGFGNNNNNNNNNALTRRSHDDSSSSSSSSSSNHDTHEADQKALKQLRSKLKKAKRQNTLLSEELAARGTPTPPPTFRIHLCVFTYNRLKGLRRLLQSLDTADYDGDAVDMTIFYDKLKKDAVDDGTADFVSSFRWKHGDLKVHRRESNAGLKVSIMEAWYPHAGDDRYGVFFEDDIEASPLWYRFAKAGILEYRGKDPKLLGVSLFRPIHDELTEKGMKFNTHNKPYLLQQPCSWGAVYFPGPWRRFRDWYHNEGSLGDATTKSHGIPRISSNTWGSKSSWKKYLIKYMWENGLYMVYPNLPDAKVFATNHLMKGEHPTPKRDLFELPLLTQGDYDGAKAEGVDLLQTPPLEELAAYDLAVRKVAGYEEIPQHDVVW